MRRTEDCKEFNEFCTQYGLNPDDVLDCICDAQCGAEYEEIEITNIENHDIHGLNVTLTGSYKHDGKEWCFSIESGNSNGTIVEEWEYEKRSSDQIYSKHPCTCPMNVLMAQGCVCGGI